LSEDLQIEKQSLRRQAVEAQQLVADVQPALEAHNNRIARLEEIRKQIDLFVEKLPTQISSIEAHLTQSDNEIKRVERVSTERFLMNQERLEEVRRQQDAKMAEIEEGSDQHLRKVNAWLERLDSWVRELEHLHSRATGHIDELQRDHSAHLAELEQRDVRLVTTLSMALREHLAAIQAEQVERGIAQQD
jgi:chromosome segregation ATPase